MDSISFSKKEKRTVIAAVTIGNLLEWYEIYLYVYWAPIISSLFLGSDSPLVNMTNTFLIFAVGFLARPFGGIFFGRLGDRIGRRKSLLLSLAVMTIPTFVTGFLPTYANIGIFAPIILCFMRILQSFPAGGELPGAFCYLYESSHLKDRRHMTSWAVVGYQLGILISTTECFFLEKYLSHESLVTWGWRASFIIGGVISLIGLVLRYRLHETPVYREMVEHERIVPEPLFRVLSKHKKGIFLGILFCALNSSAMYLLTANFPVFLGSLIGVSYSQNLLITIVLLVIMTVPIPFFGRIADKVNNKAILVLSTLSVIALLYPIFWAITTASIWAMFFCTLIFILLITWISALIPFIMAHLFPPIVRFTCVALSFNIADAIIGGFTPAIALYLVEYTGTRTSFIWILLAVALISLSGFIWMKNGKMHEERT